MFKVHVRECSARKLENAEESIRKIRRRVKMEQTSKKVIQRRLEAINAQRPFSRPRNLYALLFLPREATTITILKHYKTLALLCHPDMGCWADPLQSYFAGGKFYGGQESPEYII